MAHFARVDENNIVTNVIVIPDSKENDGMSYINNDLNMPGLWIQTSYNTKNGFHYDPVTGNLSSDQTKALRKNYASIGGTYDPIRDEFVDIAPFQSWVLDGENNWIAPVEKPIISVDQDLIWDENSIRWIILEFPDKPNDTSVVVLG